MHYFCTKKTQNCKNRKIDFFLYLLCAHSEFFMRQLYDIMLFSKIFFYEFLTPSSYLKFCLKKIFSEKKARVPKFRKKKGKKVEKLRNLADRPESAKYIWGTNLYVLDGYSV